VCVRVGVCLRVVFRMAVCFVCMCFVWVRWIGMLARGVMCCVQVSKSACVCMWVWCVSLLLGVSVSVTRSRDMWRVRVRNRFASCASPEVWPIRSLENEGVNQKWARGSKREREREHKIKNVSCVPSSVFFGKKKTMIFSKSLPLF